LTNLLIINLFLEFVKIQSLC